MNVYINAFYIGSTILEGVVLVLVTTLGYQLRSLGEQRGSQDTEFLGKAQIAA